MAQAAQASYRHSSSIPPPPLTTETTPQVTGANYAFSASSVAGVGIGEMYTNSPLSIGTTTTMSIMGWYSSSVSLESTTTAYAAYSGCSVAGVGIGEMFNSPLSIGTTTTMSMWNSSSVSLQSTTTSGYNNVFSGSSVLGVSIASTNSPCTIVTPTTGDGGGVTAVLKGSSATVSASCSASGGGTCYNAAAVLSTAGVTASGSCTGSMTVYQSLATINACLSLSSGKAQCGSATPVTAAGACCGPLTAAYMALPDSVLALLPSTSLVPSLPSPTWVDGFYSPPPPPVTQTRATSRSASLSSSDSNQNTASANMSASRSPQSQTASRSETPTMTTATQTAIPTHTTSVSRSESSSLSGSREVTTTLISATRSSTASGSGVSNTTMPSHSSSLSSSCSGSESSAKSKSARSAASSVSPSVSPSDVLPRSADLATTPLLETATVSVAVVSAVASIGSLTSGANAGRISVLLRMASCGTGDAEQQQQQQQQQQAPLPWSSHPLGFAVPSAGLATQYDAGAVLGNTAIAVAVAALHFAASCMRLLQRRCHGGGASGLARAAVWAHFPGLSSAVHLYLMPLVAQSAVSCIARGTGVGFVMGVCALVVLACVVACLTYHTVRTLGQLMECGPPGRGGWLEPACEWRLRGDEHASTKTATLTLEQLCACFGAYFEDYHYASRWWLTVELTVALVSGMIGGLMDTSAGCVVVQALGVVPNAVYLALLLWRRPYQRRLDMATCTAVGTLLLASAVALCAGSADASSWTALAASMVGFVPALCTPYKLAQQLRTMRRLKQQRRETEKRHQTHLAQLHATDASDTTLLNRCSIQVLLLQRHRWLRARTPGLRSGVCSMLQRHRWYRGRTTATRSGVCSTLQ